jgi:hypothetical protein
MRLASGHFRTLFTKTGGFRTLDGFGEATLEAADEVAGALWETLYTEPKPCAGPRGPAQPRRFYRLQAPWDRAPTDS